MDRVFKMGAGVTEDSHDDNSTPFCSFVLVSIRLYRCYGGGEDGKSGTWLALAGAFFHPSYFCNKKNSWESLVHKKCNVCPVWKKKKELREMGRIWWCWDSLGVNTSSFIWRPGFKHGCRFVTLDKWLFSTLSLYTQVYKWMTATNCWG